MDINLSPDFPYEDYYKFVTTLGALLFWASVLVDVKYPSNETLFRIAITTIGYGLVSWILEEWLDRYRLASISESQYRNGQLQNSLIGLLLLRGFLFLMYILILLIVT